jgi:N-acetylglucosamine-6-sulfatase
VVILADDLDALSVPYMPQVQSLLVQRGVSFANAFCALPVSAPARATLLTGLHAHNHGVSNNIGSFQRFLSRGLQEKSLARWFKESGYSTALIGKSMNHYVGEDPWPYWDVWQSFFPSNGEDCSSCVYYNYSIRESERIVRYGQAPGDYLTDVLADRSIAYLHQAAQGDEPFFLWLAPSAPHAPAEFPQRYQHSFAVERAPRTPSFNEADISDKPAWHQANLPLISDEDVRELDGFQRGRLRSLQAVDDAVARIVQTLDTLGKTENTYIVFVSDNGLLLGQHRVDGGKAFPYENCTRVPFVVRGPGVPAGVTLTHLVSNVDVAPTFAELAGVAAPSDLDGKSFAPLLRPQPPAASTWRQEVLVEFFSTGADSLPEYHGLRTANASYVEYMGGGIELYDLAADPDQLQSLHRTADDGTLAQWRQRLANIQACQGAVCR